MELWEVIARESIRDLVTRYNANGDSGRFAQVRPLFALDASMHLMGQSYVGIDEVMTIFTNTQSQIAGHDTPAYLRHSTSTHQIDLVDEAHATGRVYFSVITPIGLDHWGRYVDSYRVVDGQWRFAERRVTVDGKVPDSIFPDI